MSLTSHGRCGRLKILRASSGIFSRLQHPPVGFCIQHKAINKIKPFLRDKDEPLKSSVQFVAAILRTRIYLEHGLNGFDGFIYASLFIRVVTSVVAQVIRIIRSIRVPFYPFLPRGHSSHPHNPFNPWSFLSLFAPWSFFHRVYFLRQMGRG